MKQGNAIVLQISDGCELELNCQLKLRYNTELHTSEPLFPDIAAIARPAPLLPKITIYMQLDDTHDGKLRLTY